MSAPRFPSAAEVRRGMRRIKVAHSRVEELQKAQIAQALDIKRPLVTIAERQEVAAGVVVALGSLHDAIVLYLALMGLEEGEAVEPVVEGV